MSDSYLRSLVQGAVAGMLMQQESILVDVTVPVEAAGSYSNHLIVTGRHSGDRVRITFEALDE